MKKLVAAALLTLLCIATASAMDYNYISQDAMRDRLDKKEPVTIVDICPMDQYATGHLPGSIETNAYPVKTDEERAKLEHALPALQASAEDIVIVCPGGRGGAKRTVDFYKVNGIDEQRLLILEKGMNNWPYQTEVE